MFLIYFFLGLFGTRSNSEVPLSGFIKLIVGGISWFWMAKIEKIASTAPAAPSKCPVKDFVELIDKLFRLDKHTVESGENELDVYSDKFLSNLDTSNITVESNNVKSISVGSQNTSPNSKIINGFGLNINPDTIKYKWRKYSPELTKPGTAETNLRTTKAYEVSEDVKGEKKLLYFYIRHRF